MKTIPSHSPELFLLPDSIEMAKSKSVCPTCRIMGVRETAKRTRLPRKLWMRMIPFSRLYICDECSSKYFRVAGLFTFAINS